MIEREGNCTIFAQATGAGRGGVAIIRVSGDDAGPILDRLTSPRPEPRRATLRYLRGENGVLLDRALVLWFPAPGSYTGEDSAELHLHAGPAVIEAVSDALRRAGCRPASPGEFTQRAFITGRIDLIEAEGIADLIEAETEVQRRQALSQSNGALSAVYKSWSDQLRRLVALQEAEIDFPDDVDGVLNDRIDQSIERLQQEFARHLSDGHRGEAVRRGVSIAFIGAPNVGKSSLVNALLGEERSIVSERAGTTRDVIEAGLVIDGVPVTLLDTAGLRESDDEIEREGMRRARRSAATADLVVSVTCGRVEPAEFDGPIWLHVANKSDILPVSADAIAVSAKTGSGLQELRQVIRNGVAKVTAASSTPVLTRSRHRDCIESASVHLAAAQRAAVVELRGEELRLALHCLGRLTGAVHVEDVLGEIFSSFCIGK